MMELLSAWVPWLLLKGTAAAILAVIVYVVWNPIHRFHMRHVPGPAFRPIFGNLPEFRDIGSHEFMRQCRHTYGPIFKVWFGHRPWVIVCDPDAGRRVNYKLINRPTRVGDPLMRGPAQLPHNKGLFFSRDDHWRVLHRAWQPAFYADSVRACAPHMEATTARLLGRLEELAAAGQPLDIWREVGNLTMGVVGTAAFGIDFHTVNAPSEAAHPHVAPPAPKPMQLSLRTRLAGLFALTNSSQDFVSLDEADTGSQLIESAKVLFKSASAINGSMYQVLAVLAPGALLSAINLIAHIFPDAAFRRVLESRLTVSSASLALIRAARAAHQAAAQQQEQDGDTNADNAPDNAPPSRRGAAAAAAAAGAAGDEGSKGSKGSTPPEGSRQQPRRARGCVAPGSFLDLMLSARDSAGRGLTDVQMLMQANTFTLAGYETTANTLAFSLFCLSTHPEAEAKLVAELRAAAAREAELRAAAVADGEETFQPWFKRDLEQQFPYACAVVSEALRLYPPGAITMRETGGDPFVVGPYTLPPRTTVMVGTYVMQRDPELWPQADAFLPERWLPGHEHLAARHPAAFLPFGSGGRQCIGQRFALQEVRLALVQLLQRFHFDVDWTLMPRCSPQGPGPAVQDGTTGRRSLKTVNHFTLSPAEGIWVRLVPRTCPAGTQLL